MRKVEFEVPAEIFGDFAEKLTETGLNNSVLGRNEDNEIEIEVYYEKEESRHIDELEDYLEELKGQMDDDDDDDEQDGNDRRSRRK